ncbi:MAG: DUF819 family protein [Candidatus Omnitrophica bacterium]|nr:DUF819 family protein [Candidatus Omnitrophota bacterium]
MAIVTLLGLVGIVLILQRHPATHRLFKWLPTPLWCYALPMMATTLGWLPRHHPSYPLLTTLVLPFALGLLLLGVDVPAIARVGWRAVAATLLGSVSIVLGAPLMGWLLRAHLPAGAWTGVGTLAATWTGGSMNLLAVRTIVGTPEAIFTVLIIVDALIAYSWMIVLMAASGLQQPLDRWLRAAQATSSESLPLAGPPSRMWPAPPAAIIVAIGLTTSAILVGRMLPTTQMISSASGWVVLLVTTFALGASFIAPIRRLGPAATSVGMPCLYLVLAGMGAQASLLALWAAPIWVAFGVGVAMFHGVVMLLGGWLLRIPLGVLATASQANLGGVASTPIVGAVYRQELAAVGLLLAVGLNGIGTYLGLCSAWLARLLLR